MTTATRYTINRIQEEMTAAGSHWWEPDTMDFFGCRPRPTVWQGPGGIYFVTGERSGFDRNSPTRYTVRKYLPETCDIQNADKMGEYADAEDAENAACELARGDDPNATPEPVQEAHKPITKREQFARDIIKHCGDIIGLRKANTMADRLLVNAREYDALQVSACNRELEEEEKEREKWLEKRLAKVAAEIHCKVLLGGDPRGCTVKLIFPDGFTNDFGKEGYCVPFAD